MSLKPILAPRTEQRLGLVLTPQMRQRIEMLSMTAIELSDLIATELVANPVLEEVAPNESAEGLTITDEILVSGSSEEDGSLDEPIEQVEINKDMDVSILSAIENKPEELVNSYTETELEKNPDPFEEIDYGSAFENYLDPGYKTQEFEEREQFSYENTLSKKPTLSEHLQWQLNLMRIDSSVKEVAEFIINSLDSNGYLVDSLEDIANIGNWPISTVEEAKKIVQQLDPIGIGSTNLVECFLVQLEQRGYKEGLVLRLVRGYFDRLRQYRWPDLAKELGVTIESIAAAVKIILELEPHPGRQFGQNKAYPIQPEIYIEKIDNEYYIHFNDDTVPQLRVNSHYRQLLEANRVSKEEREYIRGCFRSAVDLLKNIEHRRQTIYKVCQAIVDKQKAFLDGGVQYLKPMMLKDLAELIGIHLSTVSRVVNKKYAHTPLGVIELRRFFTDSMVNEAGEEVSTQILKLKIKKMIEVEDSHCPLTDDKLMKLMAQQGVKMSRRTVAKYRDQMNIPGSRERRIVM